MYDTEVSYLPKTIPDPHIATSIEFYLFIFRNTATLDIFGHDIQYVFKIQEGPCMEQTVFTLANQGCIRLQKHGINVFLLMCEGMEQSIQRCSQMF